VAGSRRNRVLVLLAAHNGAGWIQQQLESILSQTDVDVSLIVSDDCSRDGTRSIIANFARNARITIISPPAATGSAARNFFFLIAARDAGGFDYVAFADQDDVWHPDKLIRACRSLKAGEFAGYSSAVTAVWPDGRERVLRQVSTASISDFLFEGAGQGCTFVLGAQFYGRVREFLRDNSNLTAGIHYHDWAIYALARVWGLSWVFDPQPTMQYRQHAGNDTGARLSFAGVKKRFSHIASGWYLGQVLAITRLCRAANSNDPVTSEWNALTAERPSCARRLAIARFCIRGGRRRTIDRALLIVASLLGWL
jgi:rhamnosyltransferase